MAQGVLDGTVFRVPERTQQHPKWHRWKALEDLRTVQTRHGRPCSRRDLSFHGVYHALDAIYRFTGRPCSRCLASILSPAPTSVPPRSPWSPYPHPAGLLIENISRSLPRSRFAPCFAGPTLLSTRSIVLQLRNVSYRSAARGPFCSRRDTSFKRSLHALEAIDSFTGQT